MKPAKLEETIVTLKKLTDEFSTTMAPGNLKEQLRHLRLPHTDWPSLRIGNLTAAVPIVQGGMGVGVSLSGLASAVAEAGGIGVIAANAIGMIEPDYFKDGRSANLRALRREIRTARDRTNGILGVNIMVAVNDFHELLDVAIEERVDLVFMGAGLPIKDLPVERMRGNDVKAVPIVSSVRAVSLIFRMWKKIYNDVPDAVVFEGPLAGGHLGFTEDQLDDPACQVDAVVPDIVEALVPFEEEFGRSIPVIAGGGVYSGEDIHEVLRLGASAVQMGTRFVATDECDAEGPFKQAYIDATPDQIGLIKSPVGMPGRAIRNQFIRTSETEERPPFRCAWKCLSSCKANEARYCISIALNNARRGKMSRGFVFAGSKAHCVTKIISVRTLMDELAEGYRRKARTIVAGALETIIATVQELREQYVGMGIRVKELELAYERSLADRKHENREKDTERIKDQYDTLLRRFNDLKIRIIESLKESWILIGQAG